MKVHPTLSKDGFFTSQSKSKGRIQVHGPQGRLHAEQLLVAGKRQSIYFPQNGQYLVHFSNNTSSHTSKILVQK